MNKRVVSVLMVLALVIANLFFTGNIKALDGIRVYAAETSCSAGEQITIPICIENNTGLMGFSFEVSYDNKKLSPVSVVHGDLTTTGMLNDSIETSKDNAFKVNWSASDNVSGDGTLFNVTFNVLEDASGDTEIELSYVQKDTYDNQYYDVVLSPENTILHISGGSSDQTTGQETTTVKKEGNPVVESNNISLDKNVLTVPIYISNNTGLMGYKIGLVFDDSILTPESVDNSSSFPGSFDNNIGISKGKFDVIWLGTDDIYADGLLFAAKFILKDTSVSSTNIKISYSQSDTFKDKDKDVILECKDINVDVDKLMGRDKTTKITPTIANNSLEKNKFKKIKPKIKTIKRLKRRRVRIKIKKIKGAKGYQIKYATNKKFKKAKKVYSKKPVKIIKKLKKKKYYFKVRAYKYFGNTKVFTKWSKRKSIKVKK